MSSLNSEIIKSIEIKGNKRVSNETVKIYGDIKLNQDYSESDINKILSNLYSTNFFKNIKINLSNNVLKIDLEEFPIINKLIILGEPKTKFVEEIKNVMKSKQKGSYIQSNLVKDVDKIKKIYSSLGYNFSTIETKIKEVDESKVNLIFIINRGEITRISKIKFTGDKKIREKRLRDIIASEEDKFWKFISRNTRYNDDIVSLDKRLLQNYYKSIGYYDVKITSNSAEMKDSGNIELTYSIEAGNRYIIKKITTNADPVFDKNIFYPLNKKYQKIVGSYYSPFKIKQLLEDIDELIENNNLQFVEHNVEEVATNDSINITFNIYEGEKVLVERINILGNSITNESVIRGELLIDEGDPFTNLGLEKSVSNIKSRNIFESVETKISNGSSKEGNGVGIGVICNIFGKFGNFVSNFQ